MKQYKFKIHNSSFTLVVIIIMILFSSNIKLFSQGEGDGPLRAWRWYYSQRAYPLDSIPWGAFEHAVIIMKP